MRAAAGAPGVAALDYPPARTICNDRVQTEDGNGGSKTNLRATLADRRVPARMDQTTLRSMTVPLQRSPQGQHGSHVGLSQLQHHPLVPAATKPPCPTVDGLGASLIPHTPRQPM